MRTALATLALTAAALPVAAMSPPEDVYRSTTAAYTPYHEAPIADWRIANDAMGPMSGRMGHSGPMGGDVRTAPASEAAGIRPAQPAPEGRGGQHHPMGGQP